MIVVGICGGSGSGKSTLARKVAENLGCSVRIIGQDCYYRDHSHLPFEERVKLNYDEPEIFDFDEMYKDVSALLEGKPVTKKGYDFPNHRRADSEELIYPADVLILEGIHMFYDKRLTQLMCLKVFMHVDVDVCLLRRVKRDMKKRGRSIENIMEQYLTTVKPMYERYISRYVYDADLAIMQGGKNPVAIDAVTTYINAMLQRQKAEKRG